MNKPLLSICIPTYNRCDILSKTLSSIISDPSYNEDLIEVIVSDNGSTDNTAAVVQQHKTVKYYCNNENVKDLNFSIALDYANGHYLRLFNDTLSFKTGQLEFMLETIKNNFDKKKHIFFYQNMFLNRNCCKEINSGKQLLQVVSYNATWIGNFGVWKEDYEKIEDKDRYAPLQFVQVDWSYKLVNNGKPTKIFFQDFFEVAAPNNKGGYNVFDIFINKYLFIINQQKLPLLTFEIEKFRLFRYFVIPWFVTLMINEKDKYNYSLKGACAIILKKYWYEPYFYPLSLLIWIKKLNK